jgi:hypothetical protein
MFAITRCGWSCFLMAAVAATLLPGHSLAQEPQPAATSPAAPEPRPPSKVGETARNAGRIVTQPVRDVGVAKTKIPPVLAKAHEAPYSLEGLVTCEDIAGAAKELNEVLGPDFSIGNEKKENRAGKLAEAGGKTIVNAIIPFRGLVREISGAAPARRRLDAAIDAGYARRGFLRGVHHARGCPTSF